MTDEHKSALDRILAEQREREGPPVEFDPRGCQVVLCGTACFWIAVFFIIAWALDWNVWQYAKGVM